MSQEPEEVWVGLGQQGRVEQCPGQVQLILHFCQRFFFFFLAVLAVYVYFTIVPLIVGNVLVDVEIVSIFPIIVRFFHMVHMVRV